MLDPSEIATQIHNTTPFIALGGVLVASLVGSLHCIGMCGPIVFAVAPTKTKKIAYNLGRLYAYMLVSFLFAIFGKKIFSLSGIEYWQKAFIAFFAGGLIFLGINLVLKKKTHPFKGFERLQGKLLQLHFSTNSWVSAFFIGLSSVLLPCGWLYSFIFVSALAGEPLLSLGVAFAFWLGTLPSMSFGPEIVKQFLVPIAKRAPNLSGALLILVGIFVFWQRWDKTSFLPGIVEKQSQQQSCH